MTPRAALRVRSLAMRLGLAATVLVACSFSTTIENPVMIDAPMIDANPLPACPAAPSGCVQFNCLTNPASCYYYCNSTESSNTANNECMKIATGACLVTLNDADENACVIAAAGGSGLIYVGLKQSPSGSEPSGGWGWYCGTSAFGPMWSTNEPNNAGILSEEDCGASNTGGRWVDVNCVEQFRYVCEAPRPAG